MRKNARPVPRILIRVVLLGLLLATVAGGTLRGIPPSAAHAREHLGLPSARHVQSKAARQAQVSEAYGKLPLYFEANRGQTDTQVKFLSRGPGHALFLTATEAVLVLTKREPPANAKVHGARLRAEEGGQVSRTVLRMTF